MAEMLLWSCAVDRVKLPRVGQSPALPRPAGCVPNAPGTGRHDKGSQKERLLAQGRVPDAQDLLAAVTCTKRGEAGPPCVTED